VLIPFGSLRNVEDCHREFKQFVGGIAVIMDLLRVPKYRREIILDENGSASLSTGRSEIRQTEGRDFATTWAAYFKRRPETLKGRSPKVPFLVK
jgi:hypothetical protein